MILDSGFKDGLRLENKPNDRESGPAEHQEHDSSVVSPERVSPELPAVWCPLNSREADAVRSIPLAQLAFQGSITRAPLASKCFVLRVMTCSP